MSESVYNVSLDMENYFLKFFLKKYFFLNL